MATKKNPLQIEIVSNTLNTPGWRWRMWRSGHIVASGPFKVDGAPGTYVKRAQCRRTLLRLMAVISSQTYVWKGDSGKGERCRNS